MRHTLIAAVFVSGIGATALAQTAGPAVEPSARGAATAKGKATSVPAAMTATGEIAIAPQSVGLPRKKPASRPKGKVIAAKAIFGAAATPARLSPRAIGFYSRGCLAGGKALPIDGEVWQAMRLSRNRNWGHPLLVRIIERLAEDGAAKDGWPGLLVGDMSQPRGGPMLTGHASHQVGLDADIWLTPMPYRRLSREEREKMSAVSMLGPDSIHVDPKIFTQHHAALIRRAASYPEVERVFVHPGIKKALCEEKGVDHTHFHKIRPYWGHYYHMHVRIGCPKGSDNCRNQPPTPSDDGCGAEVDNWIALVKRSLQPKPRVPPSKPAKPRPPITLADLPDECRAVVDAGKSGLLADGKAGGGAAGK